jgi:predicted transcriptional regulator
MPRIIAGDMDADTDRKLIVDVDPEFRQLLADSLTRSGFKSVPVRQIQMDDVAVDRRAVNKPVPINSARKTSNRLRFARKLDAASRSVLIAQWPLPKRGPRSEA